MADGTGEGGEGHVPSQLGIAIIMQQDIYARTQIPVPHACLDLTGAESAGGHAGEHVGP